MEQYEIDDMMTNLQGYLERQNINTSRFFRCLNPQHIDSNASMKYFDDCKVYCFGCGCCYDLVGVIGAVEGLDRREAFKKAKEYYYSNFQKTATYRQKTTNQGSHIKEQKNYDKAYYIWQKNLKFNYEAKKYLRKRCISEQTIKKFGIGFNEFNFGDFSFKAVVIPINEHCFSARNISDNNDLRYYKPRGSNIEMFNKQALNNNEPYCIITEGEFDCLSFETIGLNSMALSSANNINKFMKEMISKDKIYILALDNDNAGSISTNTLARYFDSEDIKYCVFDNCGFKDANKALVENKKDFEKQIYKTIEQFDIKLKKITEIEM